MAGPRPSRGDLRRRPSRLPAQPIAQRHVAGGHPGFRSAEDGSAPVGRRAERKKAAHALFHELLAQGHSRRAIARHLGWGLSTVLRYANAARWQDTIRENRPRPSRLDPYKPYLERRFAAGCTSVTHLHGELVADNAPVTNQMVRSHIATLRGATAGAPPGHRRCGR
ncbi:helix-turn-helix domain-containing protein [Streptomyces sp. NPDC001586]|uniref:helix-turn-helix domain-containing protein n=1 Tax=Streptomyces sp. NPDC001586 TaxID=3154387 RepID=UPI00331F9B14